ncbi:hypothetical protein M413DRAFT_399752 [Hebeloma cylindrosporum]|uniref:Uncharacterized protein n=1 Tax=Hebeloma cylindrosporum TaxID=76867 RepID=A0A0C3CI39_HEBCY|nr:hypothetical protein M413DRAFT_399752 [Hebeloma cylindrosporum h7]
MLSHLQGTIYRAREFVETDSIDTTSTTVPVYHSCRCPPNIALDWCCAIVRTALSKFGTNAKGFKLKAGKAVSKSSQRSGNALHMNRSLVTFFHSFSCVPSVTTG